jgi:nicotinamidase-related amidase
MSANRFTESLTRENAAVVFVDHQVGLYSGVRDIALAELKHNVVALAKAARVFKLPLVNPRTGRGTSRRLLDHRPLDRERLGRTPG